MNDVSNDDILAALREFQDSARDPRRMSFGEYREDFAKAPARYGLQAPLSPGVGMMGHMNTSSRAPTGPARRRSGEQMVGLKSLPPSRQPYDKSDFSNEPWFGEQQFGVYPGQGASTPSKYRFERPSQPPPWIDDVDMESIWYSPFEPVWPFGPPYYTRPREWNYPVGYNLNYIPARLEECGMLRGMRKSWGVLATIIETRKDQLLRLPWTIQRRDKPRARSAAVDEMRKFFRRPDGKSTFTQWGRKVLDDLFVIDAPSIFMDRNLGGKVRNAEVLDGGTIFPLIDDSGRRPDTTYDMNADGGIEYIRRQPAFQQIIYGLPMINLSEDELIYAMMRPLPESPVFGFSPVAQIMIETTEAIRKTFYQLEFWRSGSMPEMIVTVPDAWTPRQIAMFQAHFDALLSGQLTLKSKVRFVPGGMKPFDIKNASGESLWSQRDELLVRLACFAFSISPTPFVKQTNRATATQQQQTAQEEGLYPLMSWWKDDIMDRIIQEKFGYDDVEFVFLPRPEVDLLKQAQINEIRLRSGDMTLNEARSERGEEPYDGNIGDVPLIYFGSGAVPVEHVVSGEAMLPGAGKPNALPTPTSSQTSPGPGSEPMRGPARAPRASPMPPAPPSSVHKVDHQSVKDAADEAVDPTHGQQHVGNYRKGHVWVQGLNITIENAKGSTRGEKDRHGRKWKVKMPAPYGYIRGSIGADGEHMDCYIGKHPESDVVFVIDQDKVDPDGTPRGFDEHKCMIGYRTAKRALKDYLRSHFDGFGHERAFAMTELSMKAFKKWLRKGEMDRPISEQDIGDVLLRRGDGTAFGKLDTISSATGLTWYDQKSAVPKKRRKRKKARRETRGPRWLELSA